MKNILLKLHKIMSEVDFIEKDKENTHHHYKYASEQAIKTELHKQLVAHGVLFILSATDSMRDGDVTTANFSYRFIDIESMEELTGTFVGQGYDSTDKGIWKAVTGAIKYILTSTFLIPTGDDPENDEAPKYSGPQRPPQMKAVQASNEPMPQENWRDVVMHFGKYKGIKLGLIERSYLNWLSKKPLRENATTQDINLQDALAEMIEEASNPLEYEDIKS